MPDKVNIDELRQVTTDPTGRWVRCDRSVLALLLDVADAAHELLTSRHADYADEARDRLKDALARFDFGDADA